MPDMCGDQSMEVATSVGSSAGGETLIYIIDKVCAPGLGASGRTRVECGGGGGTHSAKSRRSPRRFEFVMHKLRVDARNTCHKCLPGHVISARDEGEHRMPSWNTVC
jgi:hypothetical protein